MKRLFFALWPNDIIRQKCVPLVNSMRHGSSRPIPAANLHLTLVFLGNIEASQEVFLLAGADKVSVPEITVNFNRLSFWKKPGVICLTTEKPCPELQALVNDLSSLAKNLDVKLDGRPYKPHVTLVRNAHGFTKLAFEPVQWHSNSYCLVQSHTVPPKAGEYEIIKEWKIN